MKRRLTAILLAMCLFIGLIPAVFADEATLEDSVDLDQLVAHGISLFKKLEAGDKWDSVVNTSTGCVGMGIMGWIGSSALQLLKWACADSPDYCKSVLGETLYNEIVNAPVAYTNHAPNVWDSTYMMPNWSYWRYRSFSAAELAAARTLLGSDTGIRTQKKLAKAYILNQAHHGYEKYNVRTEAALIYYCSAENHYGEGSVKNFVKAVKNALGLSDSDRIICLDQFHQGTVRAAAAGTVSTLNYRTKVYNYLTQTLGLDPTAPGEEPEPDPAPDPCPSAQFIDVPDESHWSHAGIDFVLEQGLFNGTSDTTFSPNASMTRAMLVTVLYRMANQPAVGGQSAFTDVVAGSYYEKAVIWAADNAIVNGTTENAFSPDAPVTREVLATVLFRYAQYAGNAGSLRSQTLAGFPDASSVHDYAYYAMIWATEQGIIEGDENGCLNPRAEATRAQVATILMRYCTR